MTHLKMKSLFTHWRHAGDVEVWLHSFLSSVLDGGGRSSSRPGRFASGKKHGNHCIGCRGGHSLNVLEKRKSHASPGIRTPDRLAPSLVAMKTTIMNLKSTFLQMSVSYLPYHNHFLLGRILWISPLRLSRFTGAWRLGIVIHSFYSVFHFLRSVFLWDFTKTKLKY